MAVSADEFKGALARWATGVTIVTARDGDTVHGMFITGWRMLCMTIVNTSYKLHTKRIPSVSYVGCRHHPSFRKRCGSTNRQKTT